MTYPEIVDRPNWLKARHALLREEKALTHAREHLAVRRRAMPAVRVTADYRFETARGTELLADLFDGRRQLILYHFMFGPDWEQGCPSCSFWADGFDRSVVHLAARDTTMKLVSAAPLARLMTYRERMGWRIDWVSSGTGPFNPDFGVSFWSDGPQAPGGYNYKDGAPEGELPGISVFFQADDGDVLHTYSSYARGLDMLNPAYHLLDLTPLGRDEAEIGIQAWVRRRDEYETGAG